MFIDLNCFLSCGPWASCYPLFLLMTSPNNLTQAYFSGYDDKMSCFYCGIIIEEVDETVNLARKHKISCEYSKRVIGSIIFQTWKKRYSKFKEEKKVWLKLFLVCGDLIIIEFALIWSITSISWLNYKIFIYLEVLLEVV